MSATPPIPGGASPGGTPVTSTVLAGKYRLGGELGSGAFANVFAADHALVPGLRFAVKVLRAEHAARPDLRRRFENEARALAALRSRHTVRVVDVGVSDEGRPYLVMERLEGTTLHGLITAQRKLGVAHVASLTRDILIALEEAHALGIVHRDLKPTNVFVVNEPGQDHPIAKVVDFGIVKLLEGSLRPEDHESTIDGTPCTPTYAAPEQLRGEAEPRSDLYALGHVMATALTGEPPYAELGAAQAIVRHLQDAPVELSPEVEDGPLGPIIRRACEKQPAKRYPDAAAMRREVEAVLARCGAIPAIAISATRSQFVGSGDHTAAGEWSAMSMPGDRGTIGPANGEASDDVDPPVRRPAPPAEAPASHDADGAPTRISDYDDALVVDRASRRGIALAAVGALAVALALGFALTTGDGTRSGAAVGAGTAADGSGTAPAAALGPNPVAPDLAAADIAAVVSTAGRRVDEATRVPAPNRWSLSAAVPDATARVGEGAPVPLPLRDAFGPSTRPIEVRVDAPGFEPAVIWVDHTGAVVLDGIALRRAAPAGTPSERPERATGRNAPVAAPTGAGQTDPDAGPRPGGLTILRP